MHLTDRNLTIRPATVADAGLLCQWWNDGAVMAHAGFPDGLGTTTEAIAQQLAGDSERGRRLILESDGIPVGEANYRTVSEGVAEIGIKLCETSRQNQGNGTRYLRMLLHALFEDLGFSRIVLDTNLDNRRAQHVYEKLGFRRTGIRVDAWRDQRGRWQTAVDYELLPKDVSRAASAMPVPCTQASAAPQSPLSFADLQAEALASYPLASPEVDFIRHNENWTCHVRDMASGGRFLLRVHRPAKHFSMAMFGVAQHTAAWIQSEMDLLEALSGDGNLPIQRPVRNRAGETVSLLSDGTAATLVQWLDGETLEEAGARAPLTEGDFEAIGRMLATLHQRCRQAAQTMGAPRIAYDGALLDRIIGCLQTTASQGALTMGQAEHAIAGAVAVKAHLARLLGKGRTPHIVHADLSKSNLLRIDGRIAPIDFGLCGMAFAEMDLGGLFSHFTDAVAQRAILRGYAPQAHDPVDLRAVDACFAFSVLLYIGSHGQTAGREAWFPAAMDRWCRDIFLPLADGTPLFTL